MTLTEYMTANGLTRADVAAALNVTPEAVRLWMIGARMPSRDTLAAIAEFSQSQVMPNDFVFDGEAAQ